jgi:ABC-type branched-subunit amino acid transport system substrate-binding protein
MTFPTTSQGKAIACVLKQDGHLKVGTLTTGDKGGVTLMGAMVSALQSKGITVAAQQQFALDATSAVSQVQALKSAGVDAVVVQSAGTALSTAASAFQAVGWNVPIVFTQGSVSTNLDKYVPASIAPQVKAVVVASQARPSETELPPNLKPFIQELAAVAPVQDLSVSILARDVIYAYKWAIEKAGSTDGAALRTALESISTATLPANYFYSFPNPNFTSTDHSTDRADLSQFWGLVKVSSLLDGTYVGGPAPKC